MASKKELANLHLSFMPWRPKLTTAGQQTTIPEEDLWRCVNGAPDLDGMISKRPGLTQWGQTIKVPDASATGSTLTGFSDFLQDTAGYLITDASTGLVSLTTTRGVLKGGVQSNLGTENLTAGFVVSTLTATDEWSLRFIFRGTNLPAYATTTDPNTFTFRGQSSSGNAKEFAIWADGLYWKRDSDGDYTKITNSDYIGAGAWNTVEVNSDDNGNTTVSLNDTLLATLTSLDMRDVTLTGTTAFEFNWQVEGSGLDGKQYTAMISTPMYNDIVTTPFAAQTIIALKDYQFLTSSGGTTIRSLVMAAGDYIYHDRGLEAGWRPLWPKSHANIFFAPYRTTMVWSDNNGAAAGALWQWDGVEDPKELTDAPKVRFVTEHQQRLFGWGEIANPRRLYYSGDRLPKVWFSPSAGNTEDEFDTLIDAGYMEIPSRGVSINGFVGDFFGLGVVAAEKGFWKLGGAGVFSYQLQGLKVGTGATNAESITQVGNDLWSIGAQGIASLAATEKFGDLQSAMPSIPIQNLWQPDVSSGNPINETFLDQSRLVYSTSRSTVLAIVPLVGDQGPEKAFVFNTNTQSWYGPWEVDAEAVSAVVVASPVTEVIMMGGASGEIGYFNPFTRRDFGGGYSLTLETSAINGRSKDTRLVSMVKTWKNLRLIVVPRGDWDIDLTWWTDEDVDEGSDTVNQNFNDNRTSKMFVLDEDFRLDENPDAFIRAGEELAFIDIPLDARGKNLTIKIEQTGDGEDLAIQGIELEAHVNGWEQE